MLNLVIMLFPSAIYAENLNGRSINLEDQNATAPVLGKIISVPKNISRLLCSDV